LKRGGGKGKRRRKREIYFIHAPSAPEEKKKGKEVDHSALTPASRPLETNSQGRRKGCEEACLFLP